MMLIIMMVNMESKMDVSKAVVDPMCLVDGVPLYNESVHFTSYVKLATMSVEKYFNFSKDPEKNRKMLNNIKNVQSLDVLRDLVCDDCYLFASLFSHVLLDQMPSYLKTKEMKDGSSCTWLYFLLSNMVQISSSTWGSSKNGLVFTSTPQALNARHSSLKKRMRAYDTNSSPIKILGDELKQFGMTFVDEEDAGVGQGEDEDVTKLGGSLRKLIGRIIQNTPSLAVSATGESSYYRLYMKYSSADAITAGVIRKMVATAYESEKLTPSKKLVAILKQYDSHLKRHKNVEPRNMKAVIIVSDIKKAKAFSEFINNNQYKLPIGIFNKENNQFMKSVYSTTHDGSNDDIIGDFQKDDNHILFVVNKGSRGVGTQFISFVGFLKTYSQKSLKTAIQASYRASVPVNMEHLRERSLCYTSVMSDEDKRCAEMAMSKYVKDQIGCLSFPKDVFYKGNGKTSLVQIIKNIGFEMSPFLIEEGGIQNEVCGKCRCVISMEESVKENDIHYHSRCVDSENMEVVRNDFVKIPVTKNDISIIKWGFESSIPKKEVVNHKATKLQVLINYIKDNGGSYSCLECGEEMCPDVEPIGLNKNLINVMRAPGTKSLVELMENNSKNISINLETMIALGIPMSRTPCKPVFNKLGDGEFSYRVTSCNECSDKKEYIDLENICSSESSSDGFGESEHSEELVISQDSNDSEESIVIGNKGKGREINFSEEEEEDDDSESDLSQPLSRPLSPLLRNPIPEYVGPDTPILTIQSGPHGENGISRAIECPKNISGSEIIKIFGMTDKELDNSHNSLIKRKRTVEEDTAIVRAKHHRVFQSAWSSEFDVLQKILKKSDKTWNWNSIVKHKNIDISEIDENDFMNYLLGIGRDSNDNRVSIGSGGGIVLVVQNGKITRVHYNNETIKDVFIKMLTSSPKNRKDLINIIIKDYNELCTKHFGGIWGLKNDSDKNHILRNFLSDSKLDSWTVKHKVDSGVYVVWCE